MADKNTNTADIAKAKDKIYEHSRDFLTCKITLPLGDTVLKNVHTNQFLFMTLPKEFVLENWPTIAKALSSSYNRFNGAKYVSNRWYIEGVTIDVDVKGTAKMTLDLNAFPSSTSKFSEDYRNMVNAANSSSTSTSSSKNKSSTKKTSNATNSNNTALFASKAGRDVGSNVANAAKLITQGCNTEEQRAYCIYDWVDRYVTYDLYWGDERGYTSSSILVNKVANCWDTAFLIYDLCSACKPKVRCEVYNGYYHFLDGTWGHLWNKLPYKGKMTFADTGRSGRNPIGNHGDGRYIVSGGGTPYRKNY